MNQRDSVIKLAKSALITHLLLELLLAKGQIVKMAVQQRMAILVKNQKLDIVRMSRKLDASRTAIPLMVDMTHASTIVN
jgi:hypothetical protein